MDDVAARGTTLAFTKGAGNRLAAMSFAETKKTNGRNTVNCL